MAQHLLMSDVPNRAPEGLWDAAWVLEEDLASQSRFQNVQCSDPPLPAWSYPRGHLMHRGFWCSSVQLPCSGSDTARCKPHCDGPCRCLRMARFFWNAAGGMRCPTSVLSSCNGPQPMSSLYPSPPGIVKQSWEPGQEPGALPSWPSHVPSYLGSQLSSLWLWGRHEVAQLSLSGQPRHCVQAWS